jgi:5-formyltetrahydrofolate cyclo-ligase
MREKSDLRHQLSTRRAVAFETMPDAGARLASHFPASIEIKPSTIIAAYMPIRTEIDPLPLVRALVARGGQGAMPRIALNLQHTAGRGDTLTFHLCDPDNSVHFTQNKWGILEPRADLPILTPNILLVPLLGFDRTGNRLGYGKGFYDRAIGELNAITIGLAFAAQEVPEIPTQPHDQRLDWIITQNGAYRCPS